MKKVNQTCSYCRKETKYAVWKIKKQPPMHYACAKRKERVDAQAKWSAEHVMRG